MPTDTKARTIEQTKEWYGKAVGVVFADYRGLGVKQTQELRANVREKGGELHIVKNTLFRLAAGEDIEKLPYEFHNGTTAYAFVFENEPDVAKTLVDFSKTNKALSVKGGYFGGKTFTAAQVEQLATLPPRDILIAQVIGAIAAPLTTLVGTIEALYADPIRVIGAVADKVAESSPIPAAKAEPAAPVAEPTPAEPEPVAEATATETATDESQPAAEEPAPEPAASESTEAAEPES